MKITLQNQEFIDVFNNKKRFVGLATEDCGAVGEGHVLDITGANDGPTMQRVVTHVQQQDVLLRGDGKMTYLSLKPLTKAERQTKGE